MAHFLRKLGRVTNESVQLAAPIALTGDFSITIDLSMVTNSGTGGAAVLFGGSVSNSNFAAVYGGPGIFMNINGGGFNNFGEPYDYWPGPGTRVSAVISRAAGVVSIQVDNGAIRQLTGIFNDTFEVDRFGQVADNYYSDYDLYSIGIEAPGISHYWNPSNTNGTGLVLVDEIGGNNGTLINFAGDDSQWIEYNAVASVPTGLSAVNATETTADLAWDQGPTGATNDLEWRLLNSVGNEVLVPGLTQPNYALTGLTSETLYEFRVRETLDAVTSDFSAWFGFSSAAAAVIDTTAPVIALVGGDVTVTIGDAWAEPGYSATDNVDGVITGAVVVTGTVNTATAGSYTLTYTATDAAGNIGTATRTVTVAEVTVVAYTASQSGNFNDATTWGGAGIPTSVDTFTIPDGITVTIPAGYSAISGGTLQGLTGATKGALVIATGASLTLSSNLVLQNFSALQVNGTLNLAGFIVSDLTTGTDRKSIIVQGTPAARAQVASNSAVTQDFFLSADSYLVDIEYADFVGLGEVQISSAYFSGYNFRVKNTVFRDCMQVTLGDWYQNDNNWIVEAIDFRDSRAPTNIALIRKNDANTGGVGGATLLTKVTAAGGTASAIRWEVDNLDKTQIILKDIMGTTVLSTAPSMSNSFVGWVTQGSPTLLDDGSVDTFSDSYVFTNLNNPHTNNATVGAIARIVLEATYANGVITDGGDHFIVSSTKSGGISDSLILESNTGALMNALGSNKTFDYYANHNTLVGNYDEFYGALARTENGGTWGGTLDLYSNLVVNVSGNVNAIGINLDSAGADQITNMDYNAWFGFGNIYSGVTSATKTPGATAGYGGNDLTLAQQPTFTDNTRTLATWGQQFLGTTTAEEVVDEMLKLNGYNPITGTQDGTPLTVQPVDVVNWVKQGYAASDANLVDAGHDGQHIGILVDALVQDATPVLTAPVTNQFITRSGNTGTVTVTGTYGTAAGLDGIEARVMRGITQIVSWTSATMIAGAFSVDIVVPKSLEAYTVEVRSTLTGTPVSSTVTSGAWYVGDVFAMMGDSSMQYWYQNGSAAAVPGFVILDENGYRVGSTAGEGGLSFGSQITAITGAAMLALDFGVSGESLGGWAGNAVGWQRLVTAVQSIQASGGNLAGAVMIAGYNDAAYQTITSAADVLADFNGVYDKVQTLAGIDVPFFSITVQRGTPPRLDTQWEFLLQGEIDFLAKPNVTRPNLYHAAYSYDLQMHGDTVHLSNSAYAIQAARAAAVVGAVLENLPYDAPPSIVSAIAMSGTSTYITLGNAGLISPSTGITGFRFTGGEVISAATSTALNRIELTHDVLGVGSVLTYHFEADPDISGAVKSDVGLPLVTRQSVAIDSLFMSDVTTGISLPAGLTSVTLTSWAGDAGFSVPPVADDILVGPNTLTLAADGTVTGAEGDYTLWALYVDGSSSAVSYRIDTTAPVITLIGANPLIVNQNSAFSDPGATAADDTDGTVAVVATGTVNTVVQGSYTLTYTATDAAGNIGTATRTVTVVDVTAPVITLIGGAVTLTVGDTFTEPGYSASDDTDGDITANVVVTGTVDTATAGTYTLTYAVSDAAGNPATAARTVAVEVAVVADTTAPNITLTGANPITLNQGDVFTDPGATATDNVDGAVAVTATGAVNTAVPDSYTITYTATDSAGNTATATRAVVVTDITAPAITLIGANPLSVNQDSTFVDPGATATDNVDGAVAVNVVGTVNTAVPGNYTITYTATDLAGNTVTTTRTVTVQAVAVVNQIQGINGDNILRLGQSNLVTFTVSAALQAGEYWEGSVTVSGVDYSITVVSSDATSITFTANAQTPTVGTPELTLNKMTLAQ